MISIQLPDGSKREFPQPVTVAEVAASIGTGLAKAALAGRVGQGDATRLVDTSYRIEADTQLAIVTEKDADGYRCRVPLDVLDAWPYCAREPITAAEYAYLVAHAAWARDHAPDHPKAEPRKPVDFNTIPLPL